MSSFVGKSVLVVDDDPSMLRAISKVLMTEGVTVSSASCAAEALRHLADQRGCIDVVITDLRMPDSGEDHVLKAIKMNLPSVPVVVITAFASAELRTQCLLRGAAAFLEKPMDAAALISTIGRLLCPEKLQQVEPSRETS